MSLSFAFSEKQTQDPRITLQTLRQQASVAFKSHESGNWVLLPDPVRTNGEVRGGTFSLPGTTPDEEIQDQRGYRIIPDPFAPTKQ